MLGEAFYHTFRDDFEIKATDIDLNEEWLSFLDVRDLDAIRIMAEDFQPDYIFNLAAFTDLEYCERNIDETYLTNRTGAENCALISEELDSTYIFISTAGIYDGGQNTYTESDIPAPISIYGKSKYFAEVAIKEICSTYFIFRAGWMMGGGQKDKKFVHKIIKLILAGQKELHVVTDLKGSPTFTYDFARNTLKMIGTKFYGLYNMTCEGGPTRYEVAAEMLMILGLTDKIKLIEVDSTHFKEEYFAPRPESEVLENLKLRNKNMDEMRNWKISLKDYIESEWLEIVTGAVT
ncbi:MAG: SDR family oxidoreductase [Candidatus Marinimicrobia bacterium]|nr:SDR family oxidoreductase [Candidatus Neomarinimicrobiota bacterium]